jgi:aminoglycoside phosphotransferase (APT) family kinase protein
MTAQAATHLDTERLGPYLAAHVPDFGQLVSTEKFAGGQSNPTFLIASTEGRFVLRRKPPGTLLKSAHAVDREYRIMAALAHTDVPVPRVMHLCEDETIIGSMFYVMDYVEGRIFWDGKLPDLQAAERSAIYDSMNAALAALHRVDPAAVGLADYGKPGSYFERQIARWTGQYRASETHPVSAMDDLIAWLEHHTPKHDGRVSLVHGDYRLDNMIFEPAGTRILAVLDWELSTLGHPLADLAYQCMQWRLPSEGAFRGLGGIDRKAYGIPTEAEYVELYCRRTGTEVIGNWPFYLAFSFFRLAAILQGVYKRSLDGNASNPERARLMGEAVPMMAGMALEVVGAR